MKLKIVKLEIKDNDLVGMTDYPNGVLDTYYLVNPNKDKLAELKHIIEHRFDYQYNDNISDEEFEKAREIDDNIWEAIDMFISANFVTLDIDEIYEIAY
jgi:hypothetical protein